MVYLILHKFAKFAKFVIVAKYFGEFEFGEYYEGSHFGEFESGESETFPKKAILASTQIRQNWRIFGEYSNSTNLLSSGHCLVFVQKQLIKIECYKSLKIFISVDMGRTSAYLPRPGWPASESPRTRRESRSRASPGGRPSPAAPTAGRATTRREAFRRRRDKRWSRSCRSSRPSARRKTSACRSPENNFHALSCNFQVA